MFQEGDNFPTGETSEKPAGEVAGQKARTPLVPIIVCACLSVFFMNFGLMYLLYLVPLGYAILVYKQTWLTFAAVIIVNVIFRIFSQVSFDYMLMTFFYPSLLFLSFIWIMDGNKFGSLNIRLTYRFVAASAVCSLVILFFVSKEYSTFIVFSVETFEMFAGISAFSPEELADLSMVILLRGGAISSLLFMFFINRHIAIFLVNLVKKQKKGRGLMEFFAPAGTIWVFLGSLVVILLARLVNNDFFSVIAWNIFVVCAIIFLVQGAGIAMYLLKKQTRGFRMILGVLILILAFTPLVSMVFAVVLLLGIADNWLAFRLPKKSAA